MDSLHGFEDQAGLDCLGEDEPALEHPPAVGFDERRMHVRAYNYWVSLLDGRAFPSIHDLDPVSLQDFGPHSVLLDFSRGPEAPEIAFLGKALRDECGSDFSILGIDQIPPRSLLSRLTDHYMQIIANRAPIGFEAEFLGQRGTNMLYRGILMPLTSGGESIGFIYGVINWKELADSGTCSDLCGQIGRASAAAPTPQDYPAWADGPTADFAETDEVAVPASFADDRNFSLWPDEEEPAEAQPPLPDDAGLADRLCRARESAEAVRSADHRSRAALYLALGEAWDFAVAAEAEPEDYAELLADSGVKPQARAPMTAVVKLVFGAGYDKTRLTEFAAALCWAKRESIPSGEFARYLASFEGGLKGVVQAERRARRPSPRPDRAEEIRERLRSAPAFAHVELEVPGSEAEFVLLVARREGPGRYGVVAPLVDDRLTAQALRKSAA